MDSCYRYPICKILQLLLLFFFVKESDSELPQGFYTKSSWLYPYPYGLSVVVATKSELVLFDFDKSDKNKVQKSYHEGIQFAEIIKKHKPEIIRIAYKDIVSLSENHFESLVKVTISASDDQEKDELFSFLNPAMKQNALSVIVKMLPENLSKQVKQQSVVESGMLAFIAVVFSVGILALFYSNAVGLVLGLLGGYYSTPRLYKRVTDPTVVTSWSSEKPQEVT